MQNTSHLKFFLFYNIFLKRPVQFMFLSDIFDRIKKNFDFFLSFGLILISFVNKLIFIRKSHKLRYFQKDKVLDS